MKTRQTARLFIAAALALSGACSDDAVGSAADANPDTVDAAAGDAMAADTAQLPEPRPWPAPDAHPANAGPGGPAVPFETSQVYETCAYLDGGPEDNTDHHNLLVMYDGWLLMPWAPEGGHGGITLWDFSDPCQAVEVGKGLSAEMRESHAIGFSHIGGAWAVTDGIAGLFEGGLLFWDMSDSTAPEPVHLLNVPGFVYPDAYARVTLSVFWQAPYVYATGGDNGIYVVDATDPRAPTVIKQIPFTPTMRAGQIHAIGNLLVVTTAGGARTVLLDISDPADPQPIPGGDFRIHDSGPNLTFDYPGPDMPLVAPDGTQVRAPLAALLEADLVAPAVVGSAQIAKAADRASVAFVATAGPAVLTIHADDGAHTPGDALGQVDLDDAGVHRDVRVDLSRAVVDGEVVHAVLSSAGSSDSLAAASFTMRTEAGLPAPSVLAGTRPLRSSDRVVVAGATLPDVGFIAVHSDAAGQPGEPLGATFVGTGLQTDVAVDLSRAAAPGEALHVVVHADSGGLAREAYFSNVANGYAWYARKDGGGGLIVYDISDPTHPTFAGDVGSNGNGGYVFVKDDLAFVGESNFAAIYDVSDLSDIHEVIRLDLVGDLDTVTPIGNVALLSADAGANLDEGTSVVPYAAAPDDTPPRVTWVYPPDGAEGLATTTRVGMTFNEMVDVKSAWEGSVRMYRADGEPARGRVDGWVSAQENVVNFWPEEPLEPGTTYVLEVPAGGVADYNGNRTAETFTMTFTTAGP